MPHTRKRLSDLEQNEAAYRNWEEYDSDDRDTDTAYEDLIQRDPTVCDNCFQKCYVQVSHEWWRGTFGWSDYNHWIPYPSKVDQVPADQSSQGIRLTCSNCGHRKTQIRPIAKTKMPTYIENLAETLTRKGIDHDAEVLAAEVMTRNVAENQGRQDMEVFKPALSAAIRAANGQTDTVSPPDTHQETAHE